MNLRAQGHTYEDMAETYLKNQGYTIIERNFFTRQGEIDLIAKEGRYLVFIEVRSRFNESYGSAAYSITKAKQRKIIAVANYYMYQHRYPLDTPVRFDAVTICRGEITLYRNAFEL